MIPLQEITTADQLVRYIRRMLGEPLIQIELQDEHILQVIADTVKTYTDVAYGFMQDVVLVSYNPDDPDIRLLNCVDVQKVTEKDGVKLVDFKWDSIKRKLRIFGNQNQSKLLLHVLKQYEVDNHFDLIFNESWVKDFAKAKTQLLWGQVLGKYTQNLVGGATINYDRLISEAQAEIDRLLEELQEKWVDPAPVLVG